MRKLLIMAGLLAGCAAPVAPTAMPQPTASVAPRLAPSGTPAATPTPVTAPDATHTPAPGATAMPLAPVVIISIDGLRPDAIGLAPMPVLEALAVQGAASFTAQTVLPPATLPAHTSMLTGLPPSVHGVTWNDYEPERGTIGSDSTPTLFTLAHAAGLRTLAVVGKEKFAHFNGPGAIDTFLYATEGDRDVVDQALTALADDYDLIFIHLPNTDYFGHSTGWMSETYLFQLTRTDQQLARLLAALPAEATILVTADHGGLGTAHGANLPENRTIPWVLSGPRAAPGLVLNEPISVMDTAATAAYLLGLQLSPVAEGRVVCTALGATGCGSDAPARSPSSVSRRPTPARLLFTGDINPGRCVAERALEAGDFARPFRAVAEVLQAADLTIGSLDGALSDLSPPIACGRMDEYNLIGPTRMAEGLAFAGFDLITVATNHILDCGSYGFGCQGQTLVDTLAALRAQGIEPVGAGADMVEAREVRVLERGGQRIAFLGLTAVVPDTWAAQGRPGAAPLSPEHLPTVLADIATARAQAEVVVVLVHWGVEYADAPTVEQRDWARQMIAAGASLVIGNHPHVIQPVEALDAGLVAYSLGNFVFDQERPDARRGLVLEVTVQSGTVLTWRTRPVRIERLYQPVWDGDP